MENAPPISANAPAADGTICQNWAGYSAAEHHLWDRLFERQVALLEDCAAQEFLDGLNILRLGDGGIPDFALLSERLMQCTGWQVVAVEGLIADRLFFEHLAHRRFVAGRFLRKADEMDYLQEPDIFHDVFGHVPMLSNPMFADYMQAYGEGGLRADELGAIHRLARLYWYSMEFGLIRQQGSLKIYGAGLVSSFAEARFALDSPSPHRIGMDLKRLMRTPYRIDDFQQTYFVTDSFDALLKTTTETDFAPLYRQLAQEADLSVDAVLPSDEVISHGTQDYARQKAAAR